MDPLLGEVKLVPFNFAPRGWAFCNGQLLPINQNQALFSLLGTSFGGNGQTTFALPNLQGRTIVGTGTGSGLSAYQIGQSFGSGNVALTVDQLPAHSHSLNVSASGATLASPVGAHLAVAPSALGSTYGSGVAGAMPGALQAIGGNQPHENRSPYLTLNYIIALQGIFPSRN